MEKLIGLCSFLLMIAIIGCENKKMDSGSYLSFLKEVDQRAYYSKEVVPPAHQNFYGKWRLDRIVGGFSGQGGPADFNYLEVKRYGIYAVIKDNKIIESGKIKVDTFDTSLPEILQVFFIPDVLERQYVTFPDDDGYVIFENGNMYIGQPCCDTFQRMFVKVDNENGE